LGVVGSLNALDERAGVRGALGAKRWHARLRLWWLAIAVSYGVVLVSVVLALLNEGSPVAALALGLLPGAFYSGFLYNERLRSLGTRPRLLEVPVEWPEPLPPPAAGEASGSRADSHPIVTA
jgi:hypothetical protein